MRRAAAMIVASLAAAAAAPPAEAAPAWIAPVAVATDTSSPDSQKAAMGRNGDAAVVWRDGGHVFVALKSRGMPFGAPIDLTPGGVGDNPEVAVDGAGGTVVVWESGTSPRRVQAALRAPGGTFGAPVTLSDPGADVVPTSALVAMNAAGNAVVTWSETTDGGSTYRVRAAVRTPGGTFQSPIQPAGGIAPPTPLPDVAIDATGVSTVVWYDGTRVDESTIQPDGAFSSGTVAAAGGPDPRVGMSDAGETVVVWKGAGNRLVPASRATTAAPFVTDSPISDPGAALPALATAPDGTTTVAWTTLGPTPGSIRVAAATRPAGGAFGGADALSADGETASGPAVAVGGTATSIVGWTQNLITPQAAVRPAGGAYAPAVSLPTGFTFTTTDVAADGAGNGLAAYTDGIGPGTQVVVTGYDAVAPVIDAVNVPAAGIAGTPVAMSVDAFDEWGWTAIWDFGDGATATGASVSHVYEPGDHAVTVTVTDPAGQTATAGPVTVRVATAPEAPAAPRVETGETTDVAATTARLHGRVAAGTAPADWWFEIGPTTAYGSRTAARVQPAGGPHLVAADVGGLTPGATYHYRLVARGPGGEVAGEDRTFTTAADAVPLVPAPSASGPAARTSGLRVRLVRGRDGDVRAVCATRRGRMVVCRVRVDRAGGGAMLGRGAARPDRPRGRVVVPLALHSRAGGTVRVLATARLKDGRILRAQATRRLR